MFEKSPTWKRFSNPRPKVVRVHLGHVPELDSRVDDDRTAVRTALVVALLFHLALFLVALPKMAVRSDWKSPERPVYAVQQVKFNPPPPAEQKVLPKPKEKRKVIPVPDPTPNDPEPIVVEEVEIPEIELTDVVASFGVPDAPPAPRRPGLGAAPLQVGGDVTPPVKIFGPSPPYTEEARQARIQGIVILEAIIDKLGNVDEVKVLKGLPSGLSQAAVEAATTWKYEPATRNGMPVPVFFNLTIRFALQ